MHLRLVTAPATEPVTLSEAKAQVRVTTADDDTLLTNLIPAARQRVEDITGRSLITTVWDLVLSRWPCDGVIWFPQAPLVTVDAVTYTDQAGSSQTWAAANYVVSAPSGPRAQAGSLRLVYGASFPIVLGQPDVISIRFTAGYGNASSVPAPLKQAMLLLIGDWYENREDEVVDRMITNISALQNSAKRLWGPYKVRLPQAA